MAKKPSLMPPPLTAWNAPLVTGRFVEVVSEAMKISPA